MAVGHDDLETVGDPDVLLGKAGETPGANAKLLHYNELIHEKFLFLEEQTMKRLYRKKSLSLVSSDVIDVDTCILLEKAVSANQNYWNF